MAPEADASPVDLNPKARLLAVVGLALVGTLRARNVVAPILGRPQVDALLVQEFVNRLHVSSPKASRRVASRAALSLARYSGENSEMPVRLAPAFTLPNAGVDRS
jgi:hypothetical protein